MTAPPQHQSGAERGPSPRPPHFWMVTPEHIAARAKELRAQNPRMTEEQSIAQAEAEYRAAAGKPLTRSLRNTLAERTERAKLPS